MASYKERERWKVWIGVEVEGRHFAGVLTAFVGAEARPEEVAAALRNRPHVEHLYINPAFVVRWGMQQVAALVGVAKHTTLALTPELLELAPASLLVNVHVMLVIDCPAARRLHASDTVRIDLAPYVNLSFGRGEMVECDVSSYVGDTELL
jgi:hypothetical protein